MKQSCEEKAHIWRESLLQLRPVDLAHSIEKLNKSKRIKLYQTLLPKELAPAFQELNTALQVEILLECDVNYSREIFQYLPHEILMELVTDVSIEERILLLGKMAREQADKVERMLRFPKDTAGALMTVDFITISPKDSVSQVIYRLRHETPTTQATYYLYVLDNHMQLIGVVSLKELIMAHRNKRIEEIMSKRIIAVDVNLAQQRVAEVFKKYHFLAVPVTAEGKLIGLVHVDQVINFIKEKATENIGKLSAVQDIDFEMDAFSASKKRLPWLILLLFVGMITAGIIGYFEDTLSKVMILAAFIPLMADMAGNSGTQSLAVVVRALAMGKLEGQNVQNLLKREAIAGLIMGGVCGIVISIISQFIAPGNMVLGFVVGFSLMCTLILSTIAGTGIPLIIHRLNIDPAVASGPFITTLNDIVGLMIYFSIATVLISHLY